MREPLVLPQAPALLVMMLEKTDFPREFVDAVLSMLGATSDLHEDARSRKLVVDGEGAFVD